MHEKTCLIPVLLILALYQNMIFRFTVVTKYFTTAAASYESYKLWNLGHTEQIQNS